MPSFDDGPSSPLFTPLSLLGNLAPGALSTAPLSPEMVAVAAEMPVGPGVAWGIPFEIGDVVLLNTSPVTLQLQPCLAAWLVFMHTSDLRPRELNPDGFVQSPVRGDGRLAEHAADYVVLYADGTQERLPIKRRFQIGAFQRRWGENCFEAVAHRKVRPQRAHHEQATPEGAWGRSQMRGTAGDGGPWMNWLWAWRNPHPEKEIVGLRLEPINGTTILSAVSAGQSVEHPLRWRTRRKAVLCLPEGAAFDPRLDERGLLAQAQLDLGQVISAQPRLVYPRAGWPESDNNQLPQRSANEIILEYTAHPEARLHIVGGASFPLAEVEAGAAVDLVQPVAPATRRVTLRTVEAGSSRPVAVKLHVHGESDEYLTPVDRHRIINPAWFEDYAPEFAHQGLHSTTYIPGETVIDLPLGRVYVEVSKGFEVRPVRTVLEVNAGTQELVVELERVLPWRERGWVTADTHVHFLSPMTAMLEGAGEGVNVVNLLASQWGELMTNAGDFDGQATWGAREAGGDGEYLVRVGTENRQHVMGHISLLGYQGKIIAPMTVGGPDEAALGNPVDVLLTEWARQCRAQGGLVVLPHFPNPRAEHAASIVDGSIDALEMTSWGSLYAGIDPYSLSDWYRYLNCGYLVAAVGGTDKMSAMTAVGTVRTYAHLAQGTPFTYAAWMEAVRRAETFVTYGPLLDFAVDGRPMGSRLAMGAGGGTVDITWDVASVTVPVKQVDLIVNGEVRESSALPAHGGAGSWRVRIDKSAWLALLVRGGYAGQPEMIAAHSSPAMVEVADAPILVTADAVTILEQIEGALAYIDTVGTRAEDTAYRRMRMVLVGAHRALHNRLHAQGQYHGHTPVQEHA